MPAYDDRAAAIRSYFGHITEADWPKQRCNLWYSTASCQLRATEPSEKDDDGYTVALASDTIYRALFTKDNTTHGTNVRTTKQ